MVSHVHTSERSAQCRPILYDRVVSMSLFFFLLCYLPDSLLYSIVARMSTHIWVVKTATSTDLPVFRVISQYLLHHFQFYMFAPLPHQPNVSSSIDQCVCVCVCDGGYLLATVSSSFRTVITASFPIQLLANKSTI